MSSSNNSASSYSAYCPGMGRGRPSNSITNKKSLIDDFNQLVRDSENFNNPVSPEMNNHGQNFSEVMERTIPKKLLNDYKYSKKNFVSIVYEYCSFMKLVCNFVETSPDGHFGLSMFGSSCIIEDCKYPVGVGRSKQEAKIEAARNALQQIFEKGHVVYKKGDETETNTKSVLTILNNFCMKRNLRISYDINECDFNKMFTCDVIVMGKPLVSKTGWNKHDTKVAAAEEALKMVFHLYASGPEEIAGEIGRAMTHFDHIASLVIEKADNLAREHSFTYKRLAGFVIQRGFNTDGEVVAIGTGDGVVAPRYLGDCHGRVLVDLHAEVVARRSLLKYLFKQINSCIIGSDSIFEYNAHSSKMSLKENISLHMYISSSPCGDATLSQNETPTVISKNEWEELLQADHTPVFKPSYGMLKTKGSTTVVMGKEHSVMSCSDKMLKWNFLGVQGCLLSEFVEPVFINSITIGDKFQFGHLARSLCCRLEGDVGGMSPDVRHPFLGRTSVYRAVPLASSSSHSVSVNWSADVQLPEFVDQTTGLENVRSPLKTGPRLSSRLSKMGFFFRYRENFKLFSLNSVPNLSTRYSELKRSISEYRRLREDFNSCLESKGLGSWIGMSQVLDDFAFET